MFQIVFNVQNCKNLLHLSLRNFKQNQTKPSFKKKKPSFKQLNKTLGLIFVFKWLMAGFLFSPLRIFV